MVYLNGFLDYQIQRWSEKFLHLPSPRAKMWQQDLSHMASLERFVPKGRVKMLPLQWQLKPSANNPVTEQFLVLLTARYILGKKNILLDHPSHLNQVLPTEWSLLPKVFSVIWVKYGHPHINLFHHEGEHKTTIVHVSHSRSYVLEERRFLTQLG